MISLSKLLKKRGGFIGLTLFYYLLILLLIAAVFMDFKHDRIPNGIIGFGITAGILSHVLGVGWRETCEAAVIMLISFCILYPIYKIGGLGAGDVKLFLMTGSFVSAYMQLHIILYSFIIGALFCVGKMISEGNFIERMEYLISYLYDVQRTGQWKLYEENLNSDSKACKSNKIHFALPICLSVMLGLGGIY